MRQKLLESTVKLYPELETDQLKLYLHCKLPTWPLNPFPSDTWCIDMCRYLNDIQINQRIITCIFISSMSCSMPVPRKPLAKQWEWTM
jgi:hypothetical protein